MVEALRAICAEPEVDVVVLARGGGGFEDLLPFSDERLVRAVVECPVPVVTAVGHEQDTPLCDLAADRRASTPTAAGRLVVPDLDELLAGLARSRDALARGTRRTLERHAQRLGRSSATGSAVRRRSSSSAAAPRSRRRPAGCARSRPARRSSAATQSSVAGTSSSARRQRLGPGDAITIEVADGAFGARVE